MGLFLITGNPGSGKSAMVGELTRLGQIALDTDDTIAGWRTESGLSVEQPERATDEWLFLRKQILDGRPVFQQEMTGAGAVILDGRQPTSTLAQRILSFVSPRPGD
jgi:predicted ATPase